MRLGKVAALVGAFSLGCVVTIGLSFSSDDGVSGPLTRALAAILNVDSHTATPESLGQSDPMHRFLRQARKCQGQHGDLHESSIDNLLPICYRLLEA